MQKVSDQFSDRVQYVYTDLRMHSPIDNCLYISHLQVLLKIGTRRYPKEELSSKNLIDVTKKYLEKGNDFFFCFGLAKNDSIVVQSSTAAEKREGVTAV